MTSYPCAKINLGLNIVSKRVDGYHNLQTVFYPVLNLHDELSVEVNDGGGYNACRLELIGVADLCLEQDNLVVKAYNLLVKELGDLPSVNIRLRKIIPFGAGMGGGSSDAAYTLRLLNEVLNLGLSVTTMQEYAAKLGADCPFFITSEPAYATGIGEILQPCDIPQLTGKYMLIVKPDVSVSTKEAYSGVTPRCPDCNPLDIVRKPIEQWRDKLKNDFEESIFPKFPVLQEIKTALYSSGALYASMSGSGSAMYGIYDASPENVLFPNVYQKIVKL